MGEFVTCLLNYFTRVVVVGLIVFFSGAAQAWTRARLTDVDVELQVQSTGESEFTTSARFEVSGGQFHGFDLAPQATRTLVKEKCFARIEGGLRTHVKIKTLFDGRQRVVMANRESINEGAVVFTLVHETNLQETGALQFHNGRARLDWTPIVWDHGTDSMSVQVHLPGPGKEIDFENDAMRDYEVEVLTPDTVKFRKFRTVKWYPMQVVMDFDAHLVALKKQPSVQNTAASTAQRDHKVAPRVESESAQLDSAAPAPAYSRLIPAIIALMGLFLMVWKVRTVQRAHRDVGILVNFRLLRHTRLTQRLMLSIVAIAVGLAAQLAGSVAASVPPLAVAAFLWLLDRAEGVTAPRSGGTWRPMGDDDVTALKRILAAYRRRRFSALDASTPVGMITFGIAVCVLGMGVWKMHGLWPRVAFGSTVAGLIWKVPVWFSFFRRELPVDPGIESFYLLKRWKRGLSRLVGRISPDAEAQYWIREDELGPAEVRLRVNPAPLNLNELEIAAEVVQSQTAYKICKVAILKVSPGTMAARTLAACPNTVEHHLTPDLQQEIIVLRNRRGKRDWGFTHLRQALFAIQSH